MGWLIALAVLVLLLLLPVGIRTVYNGQGAFVWFAIGPVRIRLYPRRRERKKSGQAPKKNADAFATKAKKQCADTGGRLTEFLPLVQVVTDALGYLRRKLRIKQLQVKLILASDDPCDLSINYGRSWAVLGNLMPLLERCFVIKKRNLEVECDYTADDTLVIARLDISITVCRLLYLAALYGLRGLREYIKIDNKRKGGANL